MLIATPTVRAVRQAVPGFEPVSLADAKKQCEVAQSVRVHDDYLLGLIQTAREKVEYDTGIIAATGTFVLNLDEWPCEGFIKIADRPLQTVTSIAYLDSAGDSQTWTSGNYDVDTARNMIWRAYDVSWPTTRPTHNSVTVTFTAGHASAAVVPHRFKQAVLRRVYNDFTSRSGEADPAYDSLVASLMRYSYP